MRLAILSTHSAVSLALVLALGLVPSACSNLGTNGTSLDAATTTTTAAATTTTAEPASADTTTESVVPASGGNASRSRHRTQLPDFTGWKWDDADRWLTNHDLEIVARYDSLPTSESAQFGLVRAQEPAAGTWVSKEASVQVWQGQQWTTSAFGAKSGATPTPEDFDFEIEGGTYSITITLEADLADSQKAASMVVCVYQDGAAPESGLQYKLSAPDEAGQISRTYTRTLSAGHWRWKALPYYCSIHGVSIVWLTR